MKKYNWLKVLCVAICALLLFSGCAGMNIDGGKPTSGTVETEDGKTEWKLDGNGMLTLSGTGSVAAVPVDKEKVEKVVIESGFTAIGDGAFAEMTNLFSIDIPETVEEIGDGAFKNCKKLDTVELPKALKDIASSAFEGWEDTQEIVSEWYEGNVGYFEEWYEFAKEFGDEASAYLKENEIPEETKAKLSEWWSQWKDSEYWEKTKEIAGEVASSATDGTKTWYQYWKEFGAYITDEDSSKSVPEGRPSWWAEADEITEYLEQRIADASVEIPEAFRNYYNGHKDEIDAFVDKAGEIAKSFGGKAGELGEEVAEKIGEILRGIFG